MEHVKFKVLAPGQEIYFAKVEFLFANSATGTRREILGPMPIVAVGEVIRTGDTLSSVNPANIRYNTVRGRHPALQCFTSLPAAERYIAKTIADREEELVSKEREKLVVS
jgi:hypothetical protein